MASNYSISVDVLLNTSSVRSQLDNLGEALRAGNIGLTFQEANLIMSKSLDIIEDMVDQVYELDGALTEFKKVSDLAGDSLDRYVDGLAEAGQTVGRTASEMVEAATQFRKSGFSDKDSAQLATVATMFQNVADTEISASDAAASLVSQIRAFGEGADFATTVLDAYNEV